ncbi:uracil-DNA glycosylase [Helicobacter pametensis]|uniref:uracil-DNA glycosylase n=1 Tax=Helicobacter pametensis TaxID=95149 RepID=UPI00048A3779|nr:uracil-DNA glycosylase [Helicobacter pametensis]
MQLDRIQISSAWKEALREEFKKPYFEKIRDCYIKAKQRGDVIFPKGKLTFEALNRVDPQNLKVVILGQDPYHGEVMIDGVLIPQAMGLSFSVPKPLPPPPSLKNIYKELQQSLGVIPPVYGDLSRWCDQGVMLLNAILSVKKGEASSHAHFGWEIFTDSVISYISSNLDGVVFMLWGNYAKKKIPLIDQTRHAVVTAPHPSPLARGFVGSGVFVAANEMLRRFGKEEIDWGKL